MSGVKTVTKVNFTRGLPVGTVCKCADNSGSKTYTIIGVINVNATKKRVRSATIGDIVSIVSRDGLYSRQKKVLRGIVIRQKKPIFRKLKGYRFYFEDNAIVEIDAKNNVVGTRVKGAVAREACDKVPSLNGKGAYIV